MKEKKLKQEFKIAIPENNEKTMPIEKSLSYLLVGSIIFYSIYFFYI